MVPFDEQHLVALVEEGFGEVIADFAATDDDDIHGQASLVSSRR